jgi:Tol biopolymer transport system component
VWRTAVGNPSPTKICDLPHGWFSAYLHLSPDGKTLLATCTPPEVFPDGATSHLLQLVQVPKRIANAGTGTTLFWIDAETGTFRREISMPFWVTHAQFCPDGSGRVLFNQEGFRADGETEADIISPQKPRIWTMDATGAYRPLYEEREDEWACHENWTPSGSGIVYHGATEMGPRLFEAPAVVSGRHFVAMRSWDGSLVAQYETGRIAVNHTTPISEDLAFLSDRWDGHVAVVSVRDGRIVVRNLCQTRATDLHDQDNHVHALLSPDGSSAVFTSNREGVANVYEVAIPGNWWEW